jgi:hypothetical protein
VRALRPIPSRDPASRPHQFRFPPAIMAILVALPARSLASRPDGPDDGLGPIGCTCQSRAILPADGRPGPSLGRRGGSGPL